MLTEKQKQAYDFICSEYEASSVAPSYEEIMTHLGLASKSGVHRLVTALEERGFLVRLKHRARAIAPVPPTQALDKSDQRDALLEILMLSRVKSGNRLAQIERVAAAALAGQL